ncbi:MAG: tetratricopeptide repeat protein [Bacteroidetes bacterium]|nr:tetratricopeptide repeat protein [Bacteroidota bacterium]
MKKKYIGFLCFLLIFGLPNFAEAISDDNIHDTTRINNFIEKGLEFQKINTDSAILYFDNAVQLANINFKKNKRFQTQEAEALRLLGNIDWLSGRIDQAVNKYSRVVEIFEGLNDLIQVADAVNRLGMINASHGNYFEGMMHFERFLEISREINNQDYIARAYNNIGLVYWNLGVYDKALESFMIALEINETLGNKDILAGNYNNIGNIHKNQNNLDKALEYYTKALEIAIELDKKQQIAGCYNNIGAVLVDLNRKKNNIDDSFENIDEALEYYYKALAISEEIGDRRNMSMCYNNIGTAFNEKGKIIKGKKEKIDVFNKAIDNFMKSISLKEIIGDKSGMALNCENIAMVNVDLAELHKSEPEKYNYYLNTALTYANKSMQIAKEVNSISRINLAAKSLMKVNKLLGNLPKALEYAELFIETKDSIFSEEKTKALTEVETKYQTEKKQQEIETQKYIIEKQEIENKRQITVRNFLLAGSGLLGILIILVLYAYTQKKKSNKLISEKNILLEQANEEIRAQKDEIEAQHRVVVNHKNLIELQKKKMEDSISYAQHIQSALILSEKQSTEILGEHFIIFQPKEVVSGDFYWAANIKGTLVIAVADCTGHGVSGAFMSLLGISLLNEIVRRKEIIDPATILNELRSSLVESLLQNSEQDMKREGMNICIASINRQSNYCIWAGARSPLWIIRKTQKESYEIEEFKPDSTSVAYNNKMENFTNHKIDIQSQDRLYMFSDGIIDQFGGPEGKKFSSKQLKQLLINTAQHNLIDQKLTIEKSLFNWKNPDKDESYDQVDDITLLSILI